MTNQDLALYQALLSINPVAFHFSRLLIYNSSAIRNWKLPEHIKLLMQAVDAGGG